MGETHRAIVHGIGASVQSHSFFLTPNAHVSVSGCRTKPDSLSGCRPNPDIENCDFVHLALARRVLLPCGGGRYVESRKKEQDHQ